MAVTVSVLVPFRPDGGQRDRLRDFVHARIVKLLLPHQDPEVIYWGDGNDHADVFNHGKAINECARLATGDVFLIMDADTTYLDGAGLVQALRRTSWDRRWRLPAVYHQLKEEATRSTLRCGRLPSPLMPAEIEWTGESVSWSGLVVVPKEAFWEVGGADERYIGHGADDVALGLALDTLFGKHVRFADAAVHLWHPRGVQEHAAFGGDLTERYLAAAGHPKMMRAVVAGKP